MSPTGSHLATVDSSGHVRLWRLDRADLKPLVLSVSADARITATVFSPDGTQLVVAGADGTPLLWWVDQPMVEAVRFSGNTRRIRELAISPDGARLAAICEDGTGRFWKLDEPTGEPITIDSLDSILFSPDSTSFVKPDLILHRLWSVDRPNAASVAFSDRLVMCCPPPAPPIPGFPAFRLAAFSPDSKALVTSDREGMAMIWQVGEPQSDPLVIPIKKWIESLAFSPDGGSLFIATGRWGHLAQLDGGRLTPVASRLWQNPLPANIQHVFRFLEPSGNRLQVVAQPTLETVLLTTLRFDTVEDPPIEGDPEKLLREWQKKLALKIGDDGEIVPAN